MKGIMYCEIHKEDKFNQIYAKNCAQNFDESQNKTIFEKENS